MSRRNAYYLSYKNSPYIYSQAITSHFQPFPAFCCHFQSFPAISNHFQPFSCLSIVTARWAYCAGILGLANMDTQQHGFGLIGILQPGCSRISGVRRDWVIMNLSTIQGAQRKNHGPKKLRVKTWVGLEYLAIYKN